ncbi:hypothetical protein GWC95_15750 [Sediminibacterium roseum]|uniref:DUF2116 family Zn-ribbon domain-containing protein n=1 Tax=Sediminibacterium roseum TaxID=1978412 RepID=A0ABX0A1W0_9BACT|nr:hypothetical protein [Sediminibacterium roseum]NCI51383.1 hypothetical protein [Sediminibacterium roseum]
MAKASTQKVEHPCQHCGKEIPNWRSNKKFCDEVCKFKFYNKKNRVVLDEDMKHIHGLLADNYEILKSLIGEERTVDVSYRALEEMKFDFQFVTQVIGSYHNIYTLSWLKLDNGLYRISRVPRKTYRGGYTIK